MNTGTMVILLSFILLAVIAAIVWDRNHGFYRDARFWISMICLGLLIAIGFTHYA